MADDRSPQDKLNDKEVFVLNLLGELLRKALAIGADRIIINPLFSDGDNIIFVIPEKGRAYRTIAGTEVRWKEIVARVKYDAGLDLNSHSSQDGEIVYSVRGSLGSDSRVFINIKTKWYHGHESVRLLIA